MLKLEVGKTYVARNGNGHYIDRLTPAGAFVEDSKGYSWKPDGTSWQHPTLDLVRPVIEAPAVRAITATDLTWKTDEANTAGNGAPEPKPDPIPHADLIRAVLDGKVVQCRQWKFRGEPPTVPGFEYIDCIAATSDWFGTPRTPTTVAQAAIDLMVNNPKDYEFRLKPEPVVKWATFSPSKLGDRGGFLEGFGSEQAARDDARRWPGSKVLRLELDLEAGTVIATLEAP